MKKRTKIITAVTITALVVLTFALCMFAFAEDKDALPERVYVGDTVQIPSRTLSHAGESRAATVTITSPGGGVFTGSKIVASEPGVYQITYSAVFGEETVTEAASFMALRRPKDMFITNQYATAQGDSFTSGNFRYDGVLLTMKNNAEVTFDKVIDVSDLTRLDDFLDFMVIPSSEEKADFAELIITLTDAENPGNTVTISVRDAGAEDIGGRGSYLKIGANNQKLGGYEYFWDWENNIPGATKFNTFFKFGTPTWMSFRRIKASDADGYYSMKLGFDYADKAFYVSRNWGHDHTVMVNDLDDVANYGSDIWSGFTGGKMKVSFSMNGLTSSDAKVLVGRIGDFDLSAGEYVDTKAPDILLDAKAANAPRSVVGASYRLFDATVVDDFDDGLAVGTSVKYLYGDAAFDINVAGGAFVTNYPGKYVITYTARDRSGNEAERQVEVFCDVTSPEVALDVPQSDVTCRLYQRVTVADVRSVSLSADGAFDLSVKLVAPDGREVALSDHAFTPRQAGEYLLTYTATDYVGNAYTKQFLIHVQPLTEPTFVTEPYLPAAFIYGFTYDLPGAQAFEGNGTEVAITVLVDGQACNGAFTPSEAQAERGYVTLQYNAKGESGTAEYRATVKVVSPLVVQDKAIYIDQAAYFVTDGATASMEKDYVAIRFGAQGMFTFANALNAETVSIAFVSPDKNFDSIRIRLADSRDAAKTVTLTVTYKDGKHYLSFPHDDILYGLGRKGDSIGISYSAANRTVSGVDNIIAGSVTHYDDGSTFEGFGDTVYLSVFCDTQTETTLQITNIVNQTLGHRSSAGVTGSTDLIAPEIVAAEDTRGSYSIGDTAVIAAVKAFDVLNPIRSVTVTVTAPDGTRVLNGADGREAHSIRLDTYGFYAVAYTATDTFGRKATYYKTISVRENEAPHLEVITKSIKKSYKVGDTVAIPSYLVSDNSGGYNLDIMLICPDNAMIFLMNDCSRDVTSCLNAENPKLPSGFLVDDKTFRLTAAGTYTLRFFAYDEFYNCVTTEITFEVK